MTKRSKLSPDDPRRLAIEAEEMPWKPTARFPVSDYEDAIEVLRKRGYSFGEIATWLNEKLSEKLKGTKITRGQVYYAYRFVVERQTNGYQEDPHTGEKFIQLPLIPEEEAEAKAAEDDKRLKKLAKKK